MRTFYELSYENLKEAKREDTFLLPVKSTSDMEVMIFEECLIEFKVLYKSAQKVLLHADSSICGTIINDAITDWENTALYRDLKRLSKMFPIRNECTILSVLEIKKYYNYLPIKHSAISKNVVQYWTKSRSQVPNATQFYGWVSCDHINGLEFYCATVDKIKAVVPALWIDLKTLDRFSLE